MAALGVLSPLAARLAEPSQRLTLAELADAWVISEVEARVPMMGVLAGDVGVLAKVRGAWGRALMDGASAEAIVGQPCPFEPPCALDVFFREQVRVQRAGLPKPYLFEADRDGNDLIVRLRIFGLATEWTPVAADRLVQALNTGLPWLALARMPNLKPPKVAQVRVQTHHGVELGPVPGSATIHLLTPFEDEDQRMEEAPWSFLRRASFRLSGLARWHDAELEADWRAQEAVWRGLDYDLTRLRQDAVDRASRGRAFRQESVVGEIGISGDLAALWPMLEIASLCGAGRGAAHGLGRFALYAA